MARRLAVGLLVVACAWGCGPGAAPNRSDAGSDFRATATVRDLMRSVVEPAALGLWGAVGTISNAEGTVTLEPRTEAEWAAVRQHAIALVESTNLLLIRGRHVAEAGADTLRADEADPNAELPPSEIEVRMVENWPAWTALVHALHDASIAVLDTVDRQDPAGLETTGSDLDAACESCHLTFWYPPPAAASTP